MQLRSVDPRSLAFNPDNPRRSSANEAADRQLADSIRIVGILQPPIVKATQDGLEIFYGERRTRGAIAAGLEAQTRGSKSAAITPEPTRSARPPITRKGIELIGAMRTAALHEALHEAPLDDHALLTLLVLVLAANNVSVMQPDHVERFRNECDRKGIARNLTAGGASRRIPRPCARAHAGCSPASCRARSMPAAAGSPPALPVSSPVRASICRRWRWRRF